MRAPVSFVFIYTMFTSSLHAEYQKVAECI